MNTAYILSGDGVVTLFHNGKSHTIATSHVNYSAILEALGESRYSDLDGLLDVVGAIKLVDGRISVVDNRVFFTEIGQEPLEIEGVVANRLIAFIRQKLPYKPLVRFIEKLMSNPSRRSVHELYKFLEHRGLPITEDGNFLAYKGVRSDWLDKHSGQFDNSPGNIHTMPRNAVDDDGRNTCSVGFHVGSHEYASNWAGHDGRLVLVEVNPVDAVSVPFDHDSQKLRVTTYKVVQEIEKTTVLDGDLVNDAMLRTASIEFINGDDDDDDNECPCCDANECPFCDDADADADADDCNCTC